MKKKEDQKEDQKEKQREGQKKVRKGVSNQSNATVAEMVANDLLVLRYKACEDLVFERIFWA